MSSGDQSDEPQSGADVGTEISLPPPDGAPASDADAGVPEVSTIDTGDLDVAYDSGEPADASVVDAADAPEATPDSDAPVPDDATPIFPDCVYSTYMRIQGVPSAILDATFTEAQYSGSWCQCSDPYSVTTHRVMCGSSRAGDIVTLPRDLSCNVSPRHGDRLIMILGPRGVCLGVPNYYVTPYDLSDWGAILAEQIAGHANSEGGTNDGTSSDGASDSGTSGDGQFDADSFD